MRNRSMAATMDRMLTFDRDLDQMLTEGWATQAPRAWVPALDVAERQDANLITAELPGVNPAARVRRRRPHRGELRARCADDRRAEVRGCTAAADHHPRRRRPEAGGRLIAAAQVALACASHQD